MENNPIVYSLFPTPVYVTKIPSKYAHFESSLIKEPLVEAPDFVLKKYGSRTKDSYIFNNPYYKELSDFILNKVQDFGTNCLQYNYNQYKFSQSWVSVKHPNQNHEPHTHPNSLISGVFFFGKYNKDFPPLCFLNIPSTTTTELRPPLIKDIPPTIYSNPEFQIQSLPGNLILFPSSLTHYVPKNRTNETRYSFAFNVFSPEGFGKEEDLTELKFN